MSAPERDGRRAWHRRASRPVTAWIVVWLLVCAAQLVVPQSRWLLVHIVTLGIVTNSILVWGQHFTETLLRIQVPGPARAVQVGRVNLLNAGILAACVGMIGAWPWVVVAGAAVIGGAVAWYAVDLARAVGRSLGSRFVVVVQAYVVAAALLPIGATFGAMLAFAPPEPWQVQLLIAHQAVNIFGFVGLTVMGTLITLWPTMLRTQMVAGQVEQARVGLIGLAAGVVVIAVCALLGAVAGVVAGFVLYAGSIGLACRPLVRVALRKPPRSFPTLSVAAGVGWFAGTVVAMLVGLLQHHAIAAASWRIYTVPLVAGALAQIVFGAMSYLMPTVMGGGPRQVRASIAVMDRFAAVRVGATNAGLLIFVFAPWRPAAVAGLACALVSLAAVVPLLGLMVAGFVRARRDPVPAAPPPTPAAAVSRRTLLGLAAGGAGVLAVAATAGWAGTRRGVAATTAVTVRARGMRFSPDTVVVPAGNRLVVTLINDDPTDHDLTLAGGPASPLVGPGAQATVDLGRIDADREGWCSVVGHKAMGMLFHVRVAGGTPSASAATAVAAAAAVAIDLTRPPGAGYAIRDATLPPLPAGDVTVALEAGEAMQEVAPGFTLHAMTYNGRVMGPVVTGRVGARVAAHLTNRGTMGHSVDFHAGDVSPDAVMRTLPPGQSLDYPFTLRRTGIWLYHCSTMPMSVHIASGMFGALVVPPSGAAAVDREFVLVQSEGYLGASGGEVDAAKINAGTPDVFLFNGHANQYVHAPLRVTAGQRVRFWVLAAGPSRGISFHVVGAQFDTVFKEGAYLLRPGNAEQGGAQSLDLGVAQGGFVETVFDEPGTYTFVNHDMVAAEHGARGLIVVTAP